MVRGNWTHGQSHLPEYKVWCGIIARCENPKNKSYGLYGGRCITVCERWRKNFCAFLEDMGHRPHGDSIERRDGAMGYTPENCRWATPPEQSRNKRNNRTITFCGETLLVLDWAHRMGLPLGTLRKRLRLGWSVERALKTPSSRSLNNSLRKLSEHDVAIIRELSAQGIMEKSLAKRFGVAHATINAVIWRRTHV